MPFIFLVVKPYTTMVGMAFGKPTVPLGVLILKMVNGTCFLPILKCIILFFRAAAGLITPKMRLYIPYQQVINSGLKGFQTAAGTIVDGVMYLDCKTWDWLEIGKLNANYLSIIKNARTKVYNQSGYFISDGEDVYWFNFLNNSVSINTNRTLAQSINRLDNSSIQYYKDGILYSYFPATGALDTLVVDESKFVKEPEAMWGLPLGIADMWPLLLSLFVFIVAIVYFFKAPSKKDLKRTTETFTVGAQKIGCFLQSNRTITH